MQQSSLSNPPSPPKKGELLTVNSFNNTFAATTPPRRNLDTTLLSMLPLNPFFNTPLNTPRRNSGSTALNSTNPNTFFNAFSTQVGTSQDSKSPDSIKIKLSAIIFSLENKEKHIQAKYSNREYLNVQNTDDRPPNPGKPQGFREYDDLIDNNENFFRLDIIRMHEKLKFIKKHDELIFRFVIFSPNLNDNSNVLTLFSIGDDKERMSHGQLALGSESEIGSCLAAGVVGFTRNEAGLSINSLSCKTGHFKCSPGSLLLAIRMLLANFSKYCQGDVELLTDHSFTKNCLSEKTNWELLSTKLSEMSINDGITFLEDRVESAQLNVKNHLAIFKSKMSLEIDKAKEYAVKLCYTNDIGAIKTDFGDTLVFWIDDLEKQYSVLEKQHSLSNLTHQIVFLQFEGFSNLEQAFKELSCAIAMKESLSKKYEKDESVDSLSSSLFL